MHLHTHVGAYICKYMTKLYHIDRNRSVYDTLNTDCISYIQAFCDSAKLFTNGGWQGGELGHFYYNETCCLQISPHTHKHGHPEYKTIAPPTSKY